MVLWLIFALMTAAAILAVVWPLVRARGAAASGNDLAVYQDQLAEVERDRAAGRIAPAEAEAARIEVSRRLLGAAEKVAADARQLPRTAPWRRRAAVLAALTLLPFGVFALYLTLGSPHLPDEPLQARRDIPPGHSSLAALLTQVEAHLARNPEDGRGWEVLAPVYMRLGRFDAAATARRHALRLLGSTATRESDLGEALVAEANGVVTQDAKASFDRTLALDPMDVRARYFTGVAAEQDGRPDEAARIWRALVASAPPGAAWVDFVRNMLARLEGGAAIASASRPASRPAASASESAPRSAPGPSEQDMAAAAELTPQQRNDMVRSMVDRLAERLKRDGSDLDGWLRLVRAYTVLGDPDKAREAASDARRALAPEPDKLKRLDELVKGLGLEG